MSIWLNIRLKRCLLLFLFGGFASGILAQTKDSTRDKPQLPITPEATQVEALQQQQAEMERLREVSMAERALVAYELSRRNAVLRFSLGLGIIALFVFIALRIRQRRRNQQQMRKLEQERAKKEQLAKLNELKSRFFTNISHEFRTPLTLIQGQVQQLQAELNDPRLDPKFDRIDRNARQLLELINQVLKLSQLESGSVQLDPKSIDLVPFLKNILFSFESLADQKLQQLHFQQEIDSLPILVDPEKLERVFYNLLINALKFTPNEGEITLALQLRSDQVHIGVIDTGMGIPQDQLPFVFERFFQTEGGVSHASPGTGVGLALAKELVELHGGTLSVNSQMGKGSEFWVELPIKKGKGADIPGIYESRLMPMGALWSPTEAATPSPMDAAHILIVEDNPDIRDYLQGELHAMGYRVSQAIHGKDGLHQAQIEQPDLIISDVMMPQMDGYKFVQALRAEIMTSHIPVILLTAKASVESKLNGLQVGADAYVTKPFNRAELQVRVAKLIEQREHLRQRFSQAVHIRQKK